ncbi:MAG: tRNA uridine-5-carboxymethylaminomethyl(34) synthesis enzyme MnmG [Candidatus Muiribacteriaceae bacterium]
MKKFDVIVIGGGHAGCEAAHASALTGARTLLLTLNLDTIGETPCNPSMGGPGKSQIIREIDVFSGLLPKVTDRTLIQIRMLNTKGGPAVHSLRAQVDRDLYRTEMKKELENTCDLLLRQGEVKDLILEKGRVAGVKTREGSDILCSKVIICTGTFLNGKIFVGDTEYSAGRYGEKGSYSLTDTLLKNGFDIIRLKTGTTPRLKGSTIDFSVLKEQKSEDPDVWFSYSEPKNHLAGISCHIAHTNGKTHDIIRQNIDRSPLYQGMIQGTGPRYCPSIEDKVIRFFNKTSHKIFLEPEGRNNDEYYMQGFSTSLPEDIQESMIRSVEGLEDVHIYKPGYAVEYDCIDPRQLGNTLESRKIKGLYFAGQVNGTSGYEEAAGQGLIAGINASLSLKSGRTFVLKREESYIGTLINDLTLKGIESEPYRMFTSRMDHRMSVRQDNAHLRLFRYSEELGLIDKDMCSGLKESEKNIKKIIQRLQKNRVGGKTYYDMLKRQDKKLKDYYGIWEDIPLFYEEETNIECMIKYEGYIRSAEKHLRMNSEWYDIKIPEKIKYSDIKTITIEARQKLEKARPEKIGDISRISGISAADITNIIVYIKKQ